MDNRLEEIKLRDAEHQGLTLIVHEDRRWLIGEVARMRAALDFAIGFMYCDGKPDAANKTAIQHIQELLAGEE